jgi:hypothetical protein
MYVIYIIYADEDMDMEDGSSRPVEGSKSVVARGADIYICIYIYI